MTAFSGFRSFGEQLDPPADLAWVAVRRLEVSADSQLDPGTDPGLTLGESRSTVTNGGSTFDVVRRITPTADKRLMRVDIAAVQQGGRGRAVLTMVKRVTP